jgi:general secretion pathway protein C
MFSSKLNHSITRAAIRGLYLSIGAFLIAHTVNAFVAHELAAPPDISLRPLDADDSTSRQGASPAQLAELIKTRGLFPLPAQALSSSPTGTSAAPPKPPLGVAKKVRLLGIVRSDGGGSAVIEDIASKRQALFHLHDAILDLGEIREIKREGVVIGEDDREELLQPAILASDQPASPSVETGGSSKPFAPPARRILDRREVTEAVSDPAKLMMQAHAVPFLTNGTLNGFRLDFVKQAGFFDKAGLQYGDVIKRVNGVEIRDPGLFLGVFQQVVNERTVTVDVVRAGQPTTLTYELR